MQKWEYLHAVASFYDDKNCWLIVSVNGIKLQDSDQKELYNYLRENGSEGWELVSENIEQVDYHSQFYKVQIDNVLSVDGWKIKGDKNLKDLVDRQVIEYLNKEYKYCSIAGILPTSKGTGYIGGWDILFTKLTNEYIRRFTFKRLLE